MRHLVVTLVLLALLPPAAQAAWEVRTLPTGGPATLGADGGPRGVAVVYERRGRATAQRTRILEERIGSRVRRLATGRHGFGPLEVDHDRAGRRTVAWSAIPSGGGPRSVYVREPGAGTRRLSSTGSNTLLWALDVAPSGAAVLAYWSRAGVFAATRPAGSARFAAPVRLAEGSAGFPAAGIADDGTATVAYRAVNEGLELELRRIAADGTVGAPVRSASPAPPAGTTATSRTPALAITGRGLAVVASLITTQAGRGRELDPVLASRVDAVDWAPGAPAPGPVRSLSPRSAFAGDPSLRAVGDRVVAVWTERADGRRVQARALRAVRWTASGPGPGTGALRLPRPLDSPFDRPALGGARAGAVAAYGIADRRVYAARLTRTGGFTSAEPVSPRGTAVDAVLSAADGARSVAVWTTSAGRIELARRDR